jgi:signal transduction histidine kinase/ActR/RegA family two-component response regulator
MAAPSPKSNAQPATRGCERVLIAAPTGRDGLVIASVLARAGVLAVPCAFSEMLQQLKAESTAALLVTEEVLLAGGAALLARALRAQPSWSDLPLIVLLARRRSGGADPALAAGLGVEGLALILERPLRKSSLLSVVNMALRARRRQYEVRDHINEHVRATAELEQASRAKDDFLAMLAHELRNPLAPIRNASVLMKRIPASSPPIKQLCDMIDRQSAHMATLLDGLLDVSRITRGKITLERKLLDAKSIAQDAAEIARPLMEQRGHDLQMVLPSRQLWVNGDATRLAQVLGNLLLNAARYTPTSGMISLILQGTSDQVIYRVRDNGVGIDAKFLPRVFDLFFQADTPLDRAEGGLGIGLAVVKGLVDMHDGSVSAVSDGRGKGAEFVVSLPRADAASETGTDANAPGQRCFTSAPQRILIADDNLDLTESMAMLLRQEGHEVRIALDGPSALKLAEEFVPDAALLDIGLPGLNGYQLAGALRSRRDPHDLLLIAVTGYGQPEDRIRSQGAGFDYHMVKPLDPLTVGAEIARWAKQRAASAADDLSGLR